MDPSGRTSFTEFATLMPQLRHIDPATLVPGLQAELSQLHAASAFQKVMRERRILRNVPQEQLPLNFKPVVEDLIVRHILPVVAEAEGVVDVRVPDRPRGIARGAASCIRADQRLRCPAYRRLAG